jgi:hypothetical protein
MLKNSVVGFVVLPKGHSSSGLVATLRSGTLPIPMERFANCSFWITRDVICSYARSCKVVAATPVYTQKRGETLLYINGSAIFLIFLPGF